MEARFRPFNGVGGGGLAQWQGQQETTTTEVFVGGCRYDVVVTKDPVTAALWVRELPFREPSPPVTRIIGFSHLLNSIHLSFFSRVLVLHLAPNPEVPTLSPLSYDLRRFLGNPKNLFVGAGVEEASRMLELRYGVRLGRRMELAEVGTTCGVDRDEVREGQPHAVLARMLLGWPWGDLSNWCARGGERSTGWPIYGQRLRFAVESSVVSQMLGHFAAQRHPFTMPGSPRWF